MEKRKIIEIKVRYGTNRVLQQAIDDVWKSGGGTVKIDAGSFIMYDSLHLRTGVNVIGEENRTILKKSCSISSRLSADLGYGHYDVSVEHPEFFKVGMGIYISDDQGKGFYGTVAKIIWKNKDQLGIDRMLNHDYARIRNGIVSTVFPIISAYHVKDASVENLVLEGNAEENCFIDGCRGGGAFLLQCHGIELNNLIVKNYNGDGISFQQCTRLEISNCDVSDNYGSGLHPGSGSAGVVMRNCIIKNNRKDGVFYCLRVSYTLLEGCQIYENGNDGISIGARDTDHIIEKNSIFRNNRFGIYFRKADRAMGGHRNLIRYNSIQENCVKNGCCEVFIENINNDIWFDGNKITCGRNSSYGIIKGKDCERICITSYNEFNKCRKKAVTENGTTLTQSRNLPRNIFVGPDAVSNEKIRHLNIEL